MIIDIIILIVVVSTLILLISLIKNLPVTLFDKNFFDNWERCQRITKEHTFVCTSNGMNTLEKHCDYISDNKVDDKKLCLYEENNCPYKVSLAEYEP